MVAPAHGTPGTAVGRADCRRESSVSLLPHADDQPRIVDRLAVALDDPLHLVLLRGGERPGGGHRDQRHGCHEQDRDPGTWDPAAPTQAQSIPSCSRIRRVTSPPSARPFVSRMTAPTIGPIAFGLPPLAVSAAA